MPVGKLSSIFDPLLSVIYPQQCQVCDGTVESHALGNACEACWANTRIFNGTEMLCYKCGAFFGAEAAPRPVACHKCDDHQYDLAVACGVYEKALAAQIIRLKSSPNVRAAIRRIIADRVRQIGIDNADIVIPVPLSKARRIERGFNQAEVIARLLARQSGSAVNASSLSRTIHTASHRMGVDDRARELSVRGAFAVTGTRLIEGRNVWLIDDVLTTGATASACAAVLKKSGAASVKVFTLARAVLR